MAPVNRRRPDHWHFSDTGRRFDKRRRSVPVKDPAPISKSFTRKIIYCKRCNNRVVSNVSHCPYCGKNLLPIYRRFLFWLIIIILISAASVAMIIYGPGLMLSDDNADERDTPSKPLVVGGSEDTSIKNLDLGKTVDCEDVLVTVTAISRDAKTVLGNNITSVNVQFVNKSNRSVNLYLTQWQLEGADGTREDSVPLQDQDGQTIVSDLDAMTLSAGATYTATLYFVVQDPVCVVFSSDALVYTEEHLATWLVPAMEAE